MNILTDKTAKTSNYFSRYNGLYYYYNTLDNKYQLQTGSWYSQDNTYEVYTVQEGDTYDSIALKYYGNPTYYWVICDFNRITDSLKKLEVGDTLMIPTLGPNFVREVYI